MHVHLQLNPRRGDRSPIRVGPGAGHVELRMNVHSPALHRAIMCVDVEGWGGRERTDRDKETVRAALYGALQQAFAAADVPWDYCYLEDRGDGALALIPPKVPKSRLVVGFPQQLAAALAAHNQTCGLGSRIRVRVALHAGEVRKDKYGVVGSCVDRTFRLLEAEEAKLALRDSPAILALIASEWFFEEVIRHEPGQMAASFRRVQVAVKETKTHAWLCLIDRAGPVAGETAILRAERSRTSTPRQLPAAVANFVGRLAELDTLTGLLGKSAASGAGMVVAVITGTAGVGKTALAVHWAHQVQDRLPDGNLYINLRGHDPGPVIPPDQALDRMLRALDIPAEKIPTAVEAKAELYRSLLDGRRMLVVLDNAANPEQVRPLLPGTAGCVVVVTSRDRLSGLIARDGAHPITLDRLTEVDAIDLLRQIIKAEIVDVEPDAAAELARRCAYLPLALRIAAERAVTNPHSTLADVAEELASEQHRLDVLNTDDEYTTVRTVFSWSYRALPPEAARMFRLLGLHLGPDFSIEAAAALADTTPFEAHRLLDLLTSKHLVEQTGRRRFRLHELLRCYAEECARRPEWEQQNASAVRRVLVLYLHTVENARSTLVDQSFAGSLTVADADCGSLSFATYAEARQWLGTERLNLIAAVRHAADAGHHDVAWKLTVALGILFYLREYWADWAITYHIGLNSARCLNDRFGEACILWSLGSLGHRFEESIKYYEQALAIYRKIGDRPGQAWAIFGLGHATRNLRQFEESTRHYQRALTIAREIGHRWVEGQILLGLGYSCIGLRNYAGSIDYFLQALMLVKDDRRGEGWVQHGLGYAYRKVGMLAESIDCFRKALTIFQEVDDWWGRGETLNNLGKAQHDAGEHELARQSWSQAMDIFKEVNSPREVEVRVRLERREG
jgi:tetratricopeptide (TPR) repeat protein